MKKKLIAVLIISVLYIFTIYIVQYSGIFGPSHKNQIDDNNSSLLQNLLQESNFSKDWKWKTIGTVQYYIKPSIDNDFLSQYGARHYIGTYKEVEVYIYNFVYEYQTLAKISDIENDDIEKWKREYQVGEITISIDEIYIEQFPNIICRESSETDFSCITLHRYGNQISEYIIGGRDISSDNEKKEILNAFLVTLLDSDLE
jgi:hypothetical protein